ncbi:MAG TPA: hypothetical protein VF178_02590 [Gemmatimonadaceae bacterium]
MIRVALGAVAAAVLVASTGPDREADGVPVGSAAVVGPPWISIEYPVNPHDATTRGALLLVHAFHHGTPTQFPVVGTAEGLVNGERRSVQLEFTRTSRTGVYALRQQWPAEGMWTLVISVRPSARDGDVASAVVDLTPSGEVASVEVPVRQQDGWSIPQSVAMSEIDARLRERARALANR